VSEPLIQIVDDTNQPVGSAVMHDAHVQGLPHRIVRIMVEDSNGRILLQKRAADHQLYENCWDTFAAVDVFKRFY
jgi:isopentenyl-diphosphate delta-isomerase